MADQPIVPIVMAGGAGTRLWPLSRSTRPKQFADLFGTGLSTFQETVRRLGDERFGRPIIVTHADFRFLVGEQLAAIGVEADIVLEPVRRDSAAAVATGLILAERRAGADAVCLVLAADHLIRRNDVFTEDAAMACTLAAGSDRIMTLGLTPSEPSTAYGYIQPASEQLGGHDRAFAVERFVEKPDAATAERHVADGYLWNCGYFAFAVSTMRSELERHAPDVLAAAEQAVDNAVTDLDFLRLDPKSFEAAPKISIDYAVMERSDRVGVLAGRFDWSDVGSFDALHAVSDADADGNVLRGDVMAEDTTNSLIVSDGRLTTAIGLDRVALITTDDAVLAVDMTKAAAVKALVEHLTEAERTEAFEHLRVHRPWGWYQRIDIGERFQVKHILVKPGGRLSLQKHFHRAEHWVVVRGTAEVTIDDTVTNYHENEAAYLPIGCVHRLANPGKIDLKLIEIQVGSYTGEDDIVRLEDIYARS